MYRCNILKSGLFFLFFFFPPKIRHNRQKKDLMCFLFVCVVYVGYQKRLGQKKTFDSEDQSVGIKVAAKMSIFG